MTTIKITALTDIGANIPNTTLIPVVDMTGTPTTDKATFGNVANAILSQAGNNYSAATKAVTVTASAQPNITSVGTLTELTVAANVTADFYFGDGGFLSNVTGGNAVPSGSNAQVQYNDNGSFGGDPGMTYNEGTSTFTANNFVATSTANLGAVGNVTITGGTAGQVLTTNGSNVLSWTTVSGGGSYSNANVANYLPTYTGNLSGSNLNVPPTVDFNLNTDDGNGNISSWTFTANGDLYWPGPDDHSIYNGASNSFVIHGHNKIVISTDGANANYQYQFYANGDLGLPGNVTATTFSGNGSGLSNIAGANVTGTVGNANLSQYLNVSDVNNNFSYHVVLSAGSGDKSLHIDADDNLQYNPADGILTSTRLDAEYLSVTNSVVSNLIPFDSLPLTLGNATNPWQDLYLSNSTIYLGDATISANGNSIVVDSITVTNGNVGTIGNIAAINLDGSTSNVLYGNGVFAPVSGGGNPFDQDLNTTDNVQFANITSTDAIRFENAGNLVGALGYAPTHIGIESYGSNSVYITTNDFNTWAFNGDGTLSLPGNVAGESGNVLIDSADDNFEVRGAQAVNFEANTVVNIYADASNNAYQWQFGDDGNLTLPGNSSSINYANGTPYGGGGSGYIIPYEVSTFVANTQPGFGEIQFADNEGANSAPATAQKLFINESPTNEQSLGTIFQQWTSNSYRGTLSLNNGSDSQATFNISNGRIYFEPETYRGFNAGLNQIWGDDCSINQLIITNATAPKFYNTDFLVEEDVFHASGLATGNTHVMLNIYGSSQYNPINPNDLWNTFVAFVDNVLYDNTTLRTNPDDIKTQFYNNTGSFRNNIPTQDLFQYFRFTSSSDADYFGTAPTTGGSGTGATVRIRVNPNNTYTVLGTALPGVGYIGGETLTVLGSDLGGVTPTNDLTILIDSVDGDGVITAVSYDSGTGVYPWPTNRISDGGDDQYDTGNYLNTNLASEISYANGITQTASAAFGGGDYCVMYYQSFFCMVATGVSSSVSDLFYSGDLGFDGDGLLNWTGLRSNQDVVANNNALYAYFDSEYLDGELTPTVGTTYNMTLDSAGINLDGFYAYNDTNTGDTFFGSNTDWRVESQSQLFVQSYNEMIIQTLVNQRGIGETGPALTVQAGDGSPGQKEINATAGNGGTVNVRGGDAGGSDGIDSLGNTGGSVNITGGVGSGNSQAGNVEINGGEGNNSGSINLRTDYGSNSTGKITLNTGGNGTTNTWEFRPDGSTIVPTLTVDLHNGGNQQAQTLQFGDNTQQVIITGPTPEVDSNSQRLIIQGQRGNGQYSEGGDVYLWAGDSDLYGGDIKIYAGDADNVSSGSGGYVNIAGGDGFDLGGYVSMTAGQSSNGAGASASVTGGFGNTVGGEANIRGGGGTVAGGSASILGGYGSGGPGGNVTIIGGGSGNGLAEYGNINLSAGAGTWTFDNTGKLTFPRDAAGNTDPILSVTGGTNPRILSEDASLAGPANLEITALNTIFTGSSGSAIKIYADDGEIGSTSNLQLWTNSGGNTEYSWTFGDDGNLTTSSNLVISPSGIGTGTAISQTDAPLQIASTDANGSASIGWYGNPTGPGNVVQVALNQTGGSMTVVTGDYSDTTYVWDFDAAGNLTLPTGGNIYYANGTIYGGSGGGGNTGNVTFDDITIQGVNQLNLSYDPLATANLAYLQVRGGDVASHIHLDTGNNSAYDLFVGNDDKYVQVSSTGDIIMSSYDGNTSYIWTFDQEGNLILAGGESAIQSVANSSLDPLNPNVSTMILTPSRGYSSQSLVLDPTATGHIHLRAPGANIDEPLANIFLGGEDSSFEVGYYNGSAPNVFIHSGGNTWTYGNDGTLTLPGGTGAIESLANNVSIYNDTSQNNGIVMYNDGLGNEGIEIYGNSSVVIYTDFSNAGYQTTFQQSGNILTAGSIIPGTANTFDIGNNVNYFRDAYFSGNVNADAFTTTDGGITHTGTAVGINSDAGKDIYLVADGGNASWTFGASGNLTLPGNTLSINYNNGTAAFGNISSINLTGSATTVLYGNGTFASPVAEASFSIQSSNFNATAGSRYGVDTSGGAVTATLPASPATGAAIFFADAGGAYASNNLTIARNGQTIMGASSDLTVSTNNQSVGLFYNGSTWRTYNAG